VTASVGLSSRLNAQVPALQSKSCPQPDAALMEESFTPWPFIILCVRWYLRFKLSLRNREEMMSERTASEPSPQSA
jgi:hypothetical protein